VISFDRRRDRLRRRLGDLDVQAALITRLVNVRYLSGFTGSNAALLVTAGGEDTLATDGRYVEQAANECPGLAVIDDRLCAMALVGHARGAGVSQVAYEAHDVTVDALDNLLASAEGALNLVRLGHAVEELRCVKDAEELDLLREACAIGDRALAALLPWLRTGRTEREISRRLEELMLDEGGDGRAFETIVAGGPHSSIPHHQPTDRPIERGDLLKLDFGSLYRGYHADMTRTFVVGSAPADWQRDTYDLVALAQAAGRAAAAVGAELADVDRAAREVVEAAGLGDAFPHGLGHGVGLEIHEDPFLLATSAGTLDVDVPVTIEPGVYLPGRGGVRIEDTIVVTDGTPELLTTTTKELLVVG
jgi:Xaa-Pro aminopeptidase